MHQYFHTAFGFCLWDLLALLVFAMIVAVLAIHLVRQRRRQKDFEEQLAAAAAKTAKTGDKAN